MTDIKVSASCIATLLHVKPEKRLNRLVPFKHPNVGEGAGRSGYYKPMIDAVREYHRSGNEHAVFIRAIDEMKRIENDRSLLPIQRCKGRSNIDAILAYQRVYGRRHFELQPIRKLRFNAHGLIVTARPDTWVKDENGEQILFKIGAAKGKPRDYIDFMLHLIRKAAAANRNRIGIRIARRSIVWLNVATGDEIVSELPLKHFNRTIENACREIIRLWELVPAPSSRTASVVTDMGAAATQPRNSTVRE